MIRTNKEELVELAVTAMATHPKTGAVFFTTSEGEPEISIGMAGIVYNVHVGDPAFGWEGDHVEPGVSIAHPDPEVDYAMHYLIGIGDRARVVSGLAAGAEGIVTGEHARVMVHFDDEVYEKMKVGDKILVRTYGRGMKFPDHPNVLAKKVSPMLIEKWGIRDLGGGKMEVPVRMIFPAHIMGSGAELEPEFVDQDMMTGDRAEMHEMGYDQVCLGDLVAITDTDHMYHRGYHKGGVTIAIIMHGDSTKTGHGPGVQDLLTCVNGEIVPKIDPNANIAKIFDIH